jgi:hypothetical protein
LEPIPPDRVHIAQARHLQYLQCLCDRSALQLASHGAEGEHVRLGATKSSSPRASANHRRTRDIA